MDINTCDKYNFDELTLDKPKKAEDVYLSTVNGATIQTQKLTINKVSKKLTILLSNQDIKVMKATANIIPGIA